MRGVFRRDYKCFGAAALTTRTSVHDIEIGGKIILPPSALEALNRMDVEYPMLFKLTNKTTSKVSHCGVLEFIAEEGNAYLPTWMMKNLQIKDGETLSIQNISLPIATYAKFQPVTSEFLEFTDHRAVLERGMRGYACLTTGDVIGVEYNSTTYEILVLETKPANAVTVIECDMQVDFAAPADYKEPEQVVKKSKVEDEPIMIDPKEIPGAPTFTAFESGGQRLGGGTKKKRSSVGPHGGGASLPNGEQPPVDNRVDVATLDVRGIPNYNWKPGKLTFRRSVRKSLTDSNAEKDASTSFAAFGGEGQILSMKKGGAVSRTSKDEKPSQ